MSTVYVAFDLETTGLDPQADAIMEIGAVRFGSEGLLDRFSTLVNPHRPIPPRIQSLTGISEEDVRDAPPLAVVAADFEGFLRDAVIVGHNIFAFDRLFLDAAGIGYSEALYDTYELATLLLPGLAEYSLVSLAQRYEVPFPVRHRALPDAEVSAQVFLALRRRAAQLPPEVLDQVARWLGAAAWPGRQFFREALDEAAAAAPAGPRPLLSRPALPEPLEPARQPARVPPDDPLAVLASAASRPDVLPQFEQRAEQEAMVRAVNEALNEGRRLLVEAGTGTGKSLAYLIPAACHALADRRRVVVSTATINLQEQLTGKDIPALQALLPSPRDEPLRACQLKGRRNYLCLRRFAALQATPELSEQEARIASRILIWLTQTESGDRSEMRLSPAEEPVWRRLSADGAGCTADNSPYVVEGTCFLQRARRQAEASHLVVVNHALLLSDIAAGGHVLPPYQHLIVDEAHHLEDEATRQFGFRAGDSDIADLLDRCQGLGPAVRAALRGVVAALGPGGQLVGITDSLRRAADRARDRQRDLSEQLRAFLRHHALDSEYDRRLLLNRGMRVQPDWADVEIAWDNLRLALHDALSLLERLEEGLADAQGLGLLNFELLAAEVSNLLQQGQTLAAGLATALQEDDPQRVVWLEEQPQEGGVALGWAPLHIGGILRERLYADLQSAIFTGATLAAQGSFDFIRDRLGLEDAHELLLGSPFDFRRAALILVPRDMPEPSWPDYLEALSQAIVDLARATEGRALVLFTSYATLRAAHALAGPPLQREGIEVLGQGIDGSPRQLIRALQYNPRSVILGTASFWEGIDIVGETLSLLVIARLPFGVPTEPIVAARSALYDDPFAQYSLPQAVLRFKQGFGRLIRSRTDRGVMVVLDRRIGSKAYGSAFLDSLPPAPVREALLRELPELAVRWLERPDPSSQGR